MLINCKELEKTIAGKTLYKGLNLQINEKEKVALIGRNGFGKTTLFHILDGEDTDYQGEVELKKGIRMVLTQQEIFYLDTTPLDYILDDVPHYRDLLKIIDTYPEMMGNDLEKIHVYTQAVNQFGELGYYELPDVIYQALMSFGLSLEVILSPLIQLSGGEKKYVELVKVMYSGADIALIDEPTNHMDYVGKDAFISWLTHTSMGVCVITHDRDVLQVVDKIIEIKDYVAHVYKGGYDVYLKQNSMKTISKMNTYEESLRLLDKLHKQVIAAREKKLSVKSTKARIAARKLEERLQRQYDEIKSQLDKPSIWIDQESKELIRDDVLERYHKYKDKNIRIAKSKSDEYKRTLLTVKNLSLGYDSPIFENISFSLEHSDRIMIKGRNGAGKSSLIKAIRNTNGENIFPGKIYTGEIILNEHARIGIYEQEIDPEILGKTLEEGIQKIYDKGLNNQELSKLLADYLFDPYQDRSVLIEKLSGGQKARFQIMKMMISHPNLLILDEPTNHLDLPSIEELENTLHNFPGAILYVSHDTYFVKNIGGEIIQVPG